MIADPGEMAGGVSPLEREGLDWVFRVMARNASDEDRAAAERWRSQSAAHAEAYAKAARLCELIVAQEDFRNTHPPLLQSPATRRAALGLGMTALAGYGIVQPPLQLWPSLAELTSDYRSPVGERRAIAVAQGVSVEMNTATSLSRHSDATHKGIALVTGEIAVTARTQPQAPYTIFANAGRVTFTQAACDVRKAEDGVRVLCMTGRVAVEAAGLRHDLEPRQQLVYTATSLGQPQVIDPVLVTAWRQGRLVFRDTPFRTIVAEVNRYRPGRIVVLNSQLAQRRFNAIFEIREIGNIVAGLRRLSQSSVTTVGDLTFMS